MRRSALFAFVLAAAATAAAAAPARAEYYCSPGFAPSYGRCIATAATDQIDLYLNEPGGYVQEETPLPAPLVRHRHHRHGLHARY